MDEKRLRELSGLPLNESEEQITEKRGDIHFDQFLVNIDSPAADTLAGFLGIPSKADVAQKIGRGYANYNRGDRIQFGAIAKDVLPEGVEPPKEELTENVASWRNPGKGPNINLSTTGFSFKAGENTELVASFSSGKVITSNTFADEKAQQAFLDRKTKEISKLLQKFEGDVKKLLER